jgi:hypothetical protein
MFQLYIEPKRDSASGLTTNAVVKVFNNWDL